MVLLSDTEKADVFPPEIDERTRELNRRGLAAARQALRQASARIAA